MLAVGMPSSADRPGTDHSPGARLVSAAGRPLARARMPRWLIRVRTWPSLNLLVRLGGRNPSALRTSAICRLLRPAAASSGARAGRAGEEGGEVGELVQAADGADGSPGGLMPACPGDRDVDELAVTGDVHGDVLD